MTDACKIYGAKAPWPFLKGLIRDNRPVWFFEETGLSYERVSLDPLKGETRSEAYSKLNPFQKIPTLENGPFVVTQSAAILHHLATSTGRLYPHGAVQQAKHLEWLFFAATDVEAFAVQISTLPQMVDAVDLPHAQWQIGRCEMMLARALNYLENELEGHSFLMGEEFYAADIFLGCVLYPIREHALIKDRKNLAALLERYYARSAFRRMIEINGT